MKYIKNIKLLFLGGLLCLIMPSCTDWLNVTPPDQTLEPQVYDNEYGIERALNGLYLSMANSNTYGRNMTSYTAELLAQRYNISSSNSTSSSTSLSTRYFLTQYTYSNSNVKTHIANLWLNGYNIILNINNFIKNVEPVGTNILSQENKDIMLGEAYALRGFVHLDLLRLFGPVYVTDSLATSIPYYTKPNAEWQPLEAANVIMGKIQADLDKGIALLKNDPVRTLGVRIGDEYGEDFYAHRNYRMNYYAAQTLKVRALMYQNKKSEAASLAKQLLEPTEIPEKFPWAKESEVLHTWYTDRIFFTEVLFGIHNQDIYKDYDNYFSSGIYSETQVMAVHKTNILYAFGNEPTNSIDDLGSSGDYRSKSWQSYRNPDYYVANKFLQPERETNFWYFQPLIRKTELYYVIAEVDNEISYINEVRGHRSLKQLPSQSAANMASEITKEFMREMYGEGQLFFHYKRRYVTSIRSMTGTGNVAMDKAKYVVPLPDAEKDR